MENVEIGYSMKMQSLQEMEGIQCIFGWEHQSWIDTVLNKNSWLINQVIWMNSLEASF